MEWFQRIISIYDFIRPVPDILLLAFLLYKAYDLLLKTQAAQLLKGAGFLVLIYGLAVVFRLSTLEWLLRTLAPGLFVIIAIVFQPELRKLIIRLGQGELFRPDIKPRLGQLEAVVTAAEMLSRKKRGMLVVFARRVNIKNYIDTGIRLNADISSSLIVTIFEYDTPLHDGAIIIHNNHIAAAGCFLPLSEQTNIKKSFGTRHRAALGISEQSDVVTLVVSEESGAMSLVFDGKLYYDLSTIEITRKLKELLDRGVRKTEDSMMPEISGDVFLDRNTISLDSSNDLLINSSFDQSSGYRKG
jgi:diadenylate cyclase